MRENLSGLSFGSLTVISPHPSGVARKWLCQCVCGNQRIVRDDRLKVTKPYCTCLYSKNNENHPSNRHGLSGTLEHEIWIGMRSRCRNPKTRAFNRYGGRGITVDPRWEAFEVFLADMGPIPTPKHSLERLDVNGPYSKENCKWATEDEQQNNRRDNHLITFNGETLTLGRWATRLGLPYNTLWSRITTGKWPIEKALTTPLRGR